MQTPKFVANWPVVFDARPKDPNDATSDKEYSVEALFPAGTDLAALKQAAFDALVKKWGADQSKWPAGLKSPFRDQGEKAKEGVLPNGYTAGNTFIKFKCSVKRRPGVVDAGVKPIIDPSKVYAGCWMIADVDAFAYDKKGNKGVSFGLNHVQVIADGEPIDGRIRVDQAFKPVAGTGDAAGKPATNMFG